jgi:hypothetical protein
MTDTDTDPTVGRAEAARILGWSLRTLDRRIPPGTPGRAPRYGTQRGGEIRISRELVEQYLPAPGGDR